MVQSRGLLSGTDLKSGQLYHFNTALLPNGISAATERADVCYASLCHTPGGELHTESKLFLLKGLN